MIGLFTYNDLSALPQDQGAIWINLKISMVLVGVLSLDMYYLWFCNQSFSTLAGIEPRTFYHESSALLLDQGTIYIYFYGFSWYVFSRYVLSKICNQSFSTLAEIKPRTFYNESSALPHDQSAVYIY